MRSISPITLGTPNGQASTQLEQAMQRGFSADCTTPPSFCLMASAGHTSAQVGSVQCMQIVGAVCRLPVGAALLAGLDTGPAADAPAVVDDEDGLAHASSSLGSTRSTRTAHTLNSGIFDSGSITGLVSWLAALRPPQW